MDDRATGPLTHALTKYLAHFLTEKKGLKSLQHGNYQGTSACAYIVQITLRICEVVAIQNTKFTVPNFGQQIRPGRKGHKFPNI
jgi:hypothetical protein